MAHRCALCPPGHLCEECKTRGRKKLNAYRERHRQAVNKRRRGKYHAARAHAAPRPPSGHPADVWLIPDDGIVDAVAVDVAARGLRPVRLTARERELAGARILREGGTSATLSERLSLPHGGAGKALAEKLRADASTGL